MGLATDFELSLWKYINHPDFIALYRTAPQHFTRQSRLSFSTLISLVLQKMTKSLQVEANHLGDLLNAEPVSKQALSAARKKIQPSAFQEMHRHLVSEYYQKNPPGTWKGYRVFGGDGTTLQFPRRGDLPAVFGDHFKRTTLSRVMQYVELTTGGIVAADLQPYTCSEKTIAAELLPSLVGMFKSLGCSKQIFV